MTRLGPFELTTADRSKVHCFEVLPLNELTLQDPELIFAIEAALDDAGIDELGTDTTENLMCLETDVDLPTIAMVFGRFGLAIKEVNRERGKRFRRLTLRFSRKEKASNGDTR
jgi:hypothetical protein